MTLLAPDCVPVYAKPFNSCGNSSFQGRSVVTEYQLTSFLGVPPDVKTANNLTQYTFSVGEETRQVLTGNATVLANSEVYFFRVRAKNAAGYSIATPFSKATTDSRAPVSGGVRNSFAALPGTPRGLRSTRHNMDSITLEWEMNDFSTYSGGDYVGFYFIHITADEGFNPQTKQVGAQKVTTITGLASSQGNFVRTYSFTISAINSIGRSPASVALEQATASSSAVGLASLSLVTIALVALLALLL